MFLKNGLLFLLRKYFTNEDAALKKTWLFFVRR